MEDQLFEQRTDLAQLNAAVSNIREEIGRVIVGQHRMVDLLMIGILCDGHMLIEGVPGVAKTLTAKLLAQTIRASDRSTRWQDVLSRPAWIGQKPPRVRQAQGGMACQHVFDQR